jgi:putative transposase
VCSRCTPGSSTAKYFKVRSKIPGPPGNNKEYNIDEVDMTSRTAALQSTQVPLHVYSRGVNGEVIFRDDYDYACWMDLMARAVPRYEVEPLVYNLMPNHHHTGLIQHKPYEVSWLMHDVSGKYAKFYNRRYHRFGALFAGRYTPKPVFDDAGLLRLSHYIHMNPVVARLSERPEAWPYGSSAIYIDGAEPGWVNKEPLLKLVGGEEEYRRFMREYDPMDPQSIHRFIKRGT